jgi:hypothetical protein
MKIIMHNEKCDLVLGEIYDEVWAERIVDSLNSIRNHYAINNEFKAVQDEFNP